LSTGNELNNRAANQSQNTQVYSNLGINLAKNFSDAATQVYKSYTTCVLNGIPFISLATCSVNFISSATRLVSTYTTTLKSLIETGEQTLTRVVGILRSEFQSVIQNAEAQYKNIVEEFQECAQQAVANSTTNGSSK